MIDLDKIEKILMPVSRKIGGRIRAARMREKITLQKFAEMVGVSPTYISQIERNECYNLSTDTLEKIIKILGLDN